MIKMTKGKVIGLLCAAFGALIGGIFDDFAREAEIKDAVEEYMAAKEEKEAKERKEDK